MVCNLVWTALLLISPTSLVSAAATTNVGSTTTTVNLGYAQYQGYFDAQVNITGFLSIRYAAPPLGDLRFQEPQPPVPESGVQPATQNPNTCYQAPFGANRTATVSSYEHNKRQSTMPAASEDCLFLNVFVPGTMSTEAVRTGGFPVLVWIHGGGYQFGYAAEYDGVDLVLDSLNTVVVVVIQYRLGVFGFLSGEEVKSQGALNAGLLDQKFALEWVQKYIALFGGDKGRVTIWGESAGGGSVLQHIVANGGNTQPPLFNAAITSSICLPAQYYYNGRLPQLLYDKVVTMAGCALSADAFACLQSVEAETLQAANYNASVSAFYGISAFVPVIDGTFIVERPTMTLSKGRVNGHVLLSVTNQNEGNIFVAANETLTITDYVSQLFPDMAVSQVQEAAHVYQDYGTTVEQAMLVMADSIFVCPTYYLLRAFPGRSWKGLFAVPPADHTNDVPYYFYRPSDPPRYNNIQFIRAFSQSFMSSVKYYDVNIKFDSTNITPYWNKYNTGETEMVFNRTEEDVPMIVPRKTDPAVLQRCAFWETVTSTTAQ